MLHGGRRERADAVLEDGPARPEQLVGRRIGADGELDRAQRDRIEASGAKVLSGTCFYNQYAREIGEANGWTRLLSNSAKIVNILGGYGYEPALASMEECIASACAGKIV